MALVHKSSYCKCSLAWCQATTFLFFTIWTHPLQMRDHPLQYASTDKNKKSHYNNSASRQAASQQVTIIDIIYLLWTIVPNELILVVPHMLQWINIVDSVTNTIQKPVVWTRVFIYQFGRHHGGCAVYTTSKSLYWQIDNVNNTHLLGCCLSWSRIVNTELGKSVA